MFVYTCTIGYDRVQWTWKDREGNCRDQFQGTVLEFWDSFRLQVWSFDRSLGQMRLKFPDLRNAYFYNGRNNKRWKYKRKVFIGLHDGHDTVLLTGLILFQEL
jgi:hypothetical protein